jgi:hypothetical protein
LAVERFTTHLLARDLLQKWVKPSRSKVPGLPVVPSEDSGRRSGRRNSTRRVFSGCYDADGRRVVTSTATSADTLYSAYATDAYTIQGATANTNGDYEDDGTTQSFYLGTPWGVHARAFTDSTLSLPIGGANGVEHVYLGIGDYLGSTAFVIDHDSGELVERPSYQAYGAIDDDYRPAAPLETAAAVSALTRWLLRAGWAAANDVVPPVAGVLTTDLVGGAGLGLGALATGTAVAGGERCICR